MRHNTNIFQTSLFSRMNDKKIEPIPNEGLAFSILVCLGIDPICQRTAIRL